MLRGKHGGKATKRGTSREQVPVLIARDRAGATANIALDATTAKDMDAALRPILPDDTVLCTDGSSALATAARRLGVEHHAADLSVGVRVNGVWHLQKGNAFVSRLVAGCAASKAWRPATSRITSAGFACSTGRPDLIRNPRRSSHWRSGHERIIS